MRFVLDTTTYSMQEISYNVLANPITDSLEKWVNETVAPMVNNKLEAMETGYYDFLDWTFTNLTDIITTLPVALFSQPELIKLQIVFAGYSVVMVTILAVMEGFKAVFGFNYTKFTALIGRTVFSFIASGLTMPAILFIMTVINLLIDTILKLTGVEGFGASFSSMLFTAEDSGPGTFFASVLFLIGFLYFICQALFKVGRRWFDLIMNMVSSPFAWAAYTTQGTTKYLTQWLSSTSSLLMASLVQAFYVVVLATIMMIPGGAASPISWLARFLLVLGGLYRLANPPSWIKSMTGEGSLMGPLKEAYSLITLKQFKKFGKK